MAEFDILNAVKEFYGLLALEAQIALEQKFETFRHSHERFDSDFTAYRNEYIAKLAHHIFDYTVLVCGGEMRHAYRIASRHNAEWADQCGNKIARTEAFHRAKEWTAKSVLEACLPVFSCRKWAGGYGGKAWAGIARAGLMYGKIPDIVFIDHCVDLSHNSSVYFDKPCTDVIELDDAHIYKKFLDHKRNCEPIEIITDTGCSDKLASLIRRAFNIGLITSPYSWYEPALRHGDDHINKAVERVLNNDYVEFGDKVLSPVTEISYNSNYHVYETNPELMKNNDDEYTENEDENNGEEEQEQIQENEEEYANEYFDYEADEEYARTA